MSNFQSIRHINNKHLEHDREGAIDVRFIISCTHTTLCAFSFFFGSGSHWGWWLSYFLSCYSRPITYLAQKEFFSSFSLLKDLFLSLSVPSFYAQNPDEWQVNYFFCACFNKDRRGFGTFFSSFFFKHFLSPSWAQ